MNANTNYPHRALAVFGAIAMTFGLLLGSFSYNPQAQIVSEMAA